MILTDWFLSENISNNKREKKEIKSRILESRYLCSEFVLLPFKTLPKAAITLKLSYVTAKTDVNPGTFTKDFSG